MPTLGSVSVQATAPPAADFYVAPDGDDSWSGTLPARTTDAADGPFATLQRARQAVRRQIAAEKRDVTVLLRGGTCFRMARSTAPQSNATSSTAGAEARSSIFTVGPPADMARPHGCETLKPTATSTSAPKTPIGRSRIWTPSAPWATRSTASRLTRCSWMSKGVTSVSGRAPRPPSWESNLSTHPKPDLNRPIANGL